MTDGAARLCELLLMQQGQGQRQKQEEEGVSTGLRLYLGEALSHLTSRAPQQFWTSGQARLPLLYRTWWTAS